MATQINTTDLLKAAFLELKAEDRSSLIALKNFLAMCRDFFNIIDRDPSQTPEEKNGFLKDAFEFLNLTGNNYKEVLFEVYSGTYPDCVLDDCLLFMDICLPKKGTDVNSIVQNIEKYLESQREILSLETNGKTAKESAVSTTLDLKSAADTNSKTYADTKTAADGTATVVHHLRKAHPKTAPVCDTQNYYLDTVFISSLKLFVAFVTELKCEKVGSPSTHVADPISSLYIIADRILYVPNAILNADELKQAVEEFLQILMKSYALRNSDLGAVTWLLKPPTNIGNNEILNFRKSYLVFSLPIELIQKIKRTIAKKEALQISKSEMDKKLDERRNRQKKLEANAATVTATAATAAANDSLRTGSGTAIFITSHNGKASASASGEAAAASATVTVSAAPAFTASAEGSKRPKTFPGC